MLARELVVSVARDVLRARAAGASLVLLVVLFKWDDVVCAA
jgi:hypothetical protein